MSLTLDQISPGDCKSFITFVLTFATYEMVKKPIYKRLMHCLMLSSDNQVTERAGDHQCRHHWTGLTYTTTTCPTM